MNSLKFIQNNGKTVSKGIGALEPHKKENSNSSFLAHAVYIFAFQLWTIDDFIASH
jgi:hypothetical protein